MECDELLRSRDRPVPPVLRDQQIPPVPKVKNYLAAAKGLARLDEGDCHTPLTTKSLVPAAPDSKFRRFLSAPTKFVLVG